MDARLSKDQLRGVMGLREALRVFTREFRRDMPAPLIDMFLLVALDEGRTIGHYADHAGVSKSVASRHLHDLADRDRYGDAGYGLIHVQLTPHSMREKEVWLTAKGKVLCERMLRTWIMSQ
jgi:DNA-binding MarR family transcriptional regulator